MKFFPPPPPPPPPPSPPSTPAPAANVTMNPSDLFMPEEKEEEETIFHLSLEVRSPRFNHPVRVRGGSMVGARPFLQEGDSSERLRALYEHMLEKHEHAIDSSQDEDKYWLEKRKEDQRARLRAPFVSMRFREESSREAESSAATRTMLDLHHDSNVNSPTPSSTAMTSPTRVQRGGFAPAEEQAGGGRVENATPNASGAGPDMATGVRLVDWNVYPPMSNRHYHLTSDAHDPKFVYKHEKTGAPSVPTRVPGQLSARAVAESESDEAGEMMTPEMSAAPGDGTSEAREHRYPEAPEHRDPILASFARITARFGLNTPLQASSSSSRRNSNSNSNSNADELEFCKRCGKTHIEPGPPITLSTRDPCGAYLPDWFPFAKVGPRPWDFYRKMTNELAFIADVESGKLTLETPWDREFHDEHPKWKVIGHPQGGWWRCRSGPAATEVERLCRKCNNATPLHDPRKPQPVYPTLADLLVRKKEIQDWIDKYEKPYHERIKAEALQIIRDTMMGGPSGSFLPPHRGVGDGEGPASATATATSKGKGKEKETLAENPLPKVKSMQTLILEALWVHKGPASELVVPIPASTTAAAAAAANDDDDNDDNDADDGLEMRARSRAPVHGTNSSDQASSSAGTSKKSRKPRKN